MAFESTDFEIEVESPDYLGSGRTINGYRVDGEVSSLIGPFRGRLGCDHRYWEPVLWIELEWTGGGASDAVGLR